MSPCNKVKASERLTISNYHFTNHQTTEPHETPSTLVLPTLLSRPPSTVLQIYYDGQGKYTSTKTAVLLDILRIPQAILFPVYLRCYFHYGFRTIKKFVRVLLHTYDKVLLTFRYYQNASTVGANYLLQWHYGFATAEVVNVNLRRHFVLCLPYK